MERTQAEQTTLYAQEYFTGSQASIYIGDVWIDEVFGVQFLATQNVLPLYSYASSKFDAIARGKVLIQGYFEINFIDEGYLQACLLEAARTDTSDQALIETMKANGMTDQEARIQVASMEKIDLAAIKEQVDFLQSLRILRTPAPQVDALNTMVQNNKRQYNQTFNSLITGLANLDMANLDQLGTVINAKDQTPTDQNVIYLMTPFTLKGCFGHPQSHGQSRGVQRTINNCFLISNEMIFGANDEPIKERYAFIARDHI